MARNPEKNFLAAYMYLIIPSVIGGGVAWMFSGSLGIGISVFIAVWVGNWIGSFLRKSK